jgi:hypothetical protein
MLFLRQPEDSDAYSDAEIECRRYGFSEIQFSGCGKLQIDVLNTDAYRGFAGFYEESLAHGGALVYYPNKAAVIGARPNNSFKPKPLRGSA